jgi:hypothetical protein
MRGTAEWQQPYLLCVAGEELLFRHALAYDPDQSLPLPFVRSKGEVAIQFAPGVLRAWPW